MNTTANINDVQRLIFGDHNDPFSILGMHLVNNQSKESICVRAYYPNAKQIHIIDPATNETWEMNKFNENGLFESIIYNRNTFFRYLLEVTDYQENKFKTRDPYSFLPFITNFDLHLFNEGNHHKIYEKLGAHLTTVDDTYGAIFAVWAPCARRVSVVGDFNQWDGRRHQMRMLGNSGVWEIFIPNITKGDVYKYEIKTPSGEIYVKSDPYAYYAELRPSTASKVYSLEDYTWNDSEWINKRSNDNSFANPVSVYELHLGSWLRASEDENGFLSYREIADKLVSYVVDMGFTHIELMPVAEHPFDGSWGYQTTGYYAVTSRYGTPEDFMYFVDKFHQNGIGVIVDWVPAHFPKDGHGLARFDGTAIYEHEHPMQGEHPDWGTHVFNYSRHEVKNFLISNAVFFFEKYHIDGLRVDAVASMIYLDYGKKPGEWIPNQWGGRENVDAIEFVKQLNHTVHSYFPGIMMIAEESTSFALVTKPPYVGGLGFSYKWNMGWMNDFLKYMSMDSIYRKYHQDKITFSIMYAFSENYMLVLSHDEVVHGKCSMLSKMPGDYWQKFAGLRASYGYMYGHPGKKLMFMGCEFGQFIEWAYKKSLDWFLLDYPMHKKIQDYVRDLNHLYTSEKAMHEVDTGFDGFEWIDCHDQEHSMVSFIRKGRDWKDMLIFVCNFTPVVHECYHIGAPFDLFYKEIFNSDSEKYGGSNVGNLGGVRADNFPSHGRPYTLRIKIPPLSTVVFKPIFE